jgi:hypothetical protein
MIPYLCVGLVVSLVAAEVFGWSASGLVAAGYVAYHIMDPTVLIVIALCTAGTFGVDALAVRLVILYGRRRLALDFLISMLLMIVLTRALDGAGMELAPLGVVDALIPAVLTIYTGMDGPVKLAASLAGEALVTQLFMWIAVWWIL